MLIEEDGYKNSHHDSLQKARSEIAFQNTMDSLRTNATKTKYAHSLDEYVKFLGLKNGDREDLALLLDQNTRDIEAGIISYIVHLKKEGYSYSSISTKFAGIIHFYTMNDIVLNRKKIGKYLGEHIKTVKDRSYTLEELKKILESCNLKHKIIVTLMVSSGCRIGAISDLKLSNFIYFEKEKLHQILFYMNTREEYFSFCTPECSKYINEYLEYRKRCERS